MAWEYFSYWINVIFGNSVVPNDSVVPTDSVVPNDSVVPTDSVVPNDSVVTTDSVYSNKHFNNDLKQTQYKKRHCKSKKIFTY